MTTELTRRRGEVQRWTRTVIPTSREAPADAEAPSHKLLVRAGFIRRVGAVPNHYALGYRANGMSVWDLPDERVSALGRQVGALPFVSHAYRRPRRLPLWPYNLFAMVHGRSRDEVTAKVETIAEILGSDCRRRDLLYSKRILKKSGLRLASS